MAEAHVNIKSKKIVARSSETTARARKSKQATGNKAGQTASYAAGSFLDQRGGMVPTVRLGKRASTKAV